MIEKYVAERALAADTDLEPPALDGSASELREKYRRFMRPDLVEKLETLNADKVYVRAERNHLFYLDDDGRERKVLDLVGGYGATFFGHNHPEIVAEAVKGMAFRVPFLAQGSIRGQAALLAERLSGLAQAYTGKEYVVTFANSGAEVVEAAIKHALMEREEAIDAARKRFSEGSFRLKREMRKADAGRKAEAAARLAQALGCAPESDWEALLRKAENMNAEALSGRPVFLALRDSFHGKTVAAVNLTYNASFREPFALAPSLSLFLPDEAEAFAKAVDAHSRSWFAVDADAAGLPVIERKPFSDVAGIIVEPIQGEGGIHPISAGLAAWLGGLKDRTFPVIVDEIQSGMGRTGKFLAAEHFGLVGDYFCLGKSLGGGLAKTGALLVDKDRYVGEFSLIHTSTFAEDDLSSAIGLKALEILTRNEGYAMAEAARKGNHLLSALRRLQEQYPDVIKDVRGIGLMIGVEFHRQEEAGSCFIRMLDRQDYLGYLMSGYLLNEHGIRIFPTLSGPNTLRIEPSYLLAREDIEYAMECLAALCGILRCSNMYRLSRQVLRMRMPKGEPCADYSHIRLARDAGEGLTRVAFLGHLIRSEDLKARDETLSALPDHLMAPFFERTYRLFKDADFFEKHRIRSSAGREVIFDFVGHYLTSDVIYRALKERDYQWIRDRVIDSVRMAKEDGCRVVGFGGFTSIVTQNCLAVDVEDVGLTTGNSLTVAMGIKAIVKVAAEKGLDLGSSTLGVVGATGNIGSIYSQIMAERVGRVVLIGSREGGRRLKRLAMKILGQAALGLIAKGARGAGGEGLTGLERAMAARPGLPELCLPFAEESEGAAPAYDSLMASHSIGELVAVSSNLMSLRECTVMVTASNDASHIVQPQHIGPGDNVICDIAVPRDTSPALERERSRTRIILGGVVKLPHNPDFRVGGVPLERGCSFACMAETMLLGLEGWEGNFSYGEITRDQVKRIAAIAEKHGFDLATEKTEASY